VIVNKADGGMESAARSTAADYRRALSLLPRKRAGAAGSWAVPVTRVSAETGMGIAKCVDEMERYHALMFATGALEEQRRTQRVLQMQASLRDAIESMCHDSSDAERVRRRVAEGTMSPWVGASELLAIVSSGTVTH
jgi:putative protein kinase ArgK-like GTPase of G3E family